MIGGDIGGDRGSHGRFIIAAVLFPLGICDESLSTENKNSLY